MAGGFVFLPGLTLIIVEGRLHSPRAGQRDHLPGGLVVIARAGKLLEDHRVGLMLRLVVSATSTLRQPGMAIGSDFETQGRGRRQDLCHGLQGGETTWDILLRGNAKHKTVLESLFRLLSHLHFIVPCVFHFLDSSRDTLDFFNHHALNSNIGAFPNRDPIQF